MSWLWLAAPGAVAFFGLVGLIAALGNLFKGKFNQGVGGIMGGGLFVALGLAGSLVGLNMQTYSRLTYERPVAQVTVTAVDPAQKLYNVTVTRAEGGKTQTCAIQGDEWILSGRVQKWKPWANIVGLDSTYSLDQVANKYFSAAEANGEDITACDLDKGVAMASAVVPQALVDNALSAAQIEDRRFGSANYMPLRDGAVYDVVMTQSGFNSEPANDIARQANESVPQ